MSFEASFQWLEQDVICFGEKPGRWRDIQEDIIWLKNQKIASILSLVEEEEQLEAYRISGFHTFHVPVDDFSAPTMVQIDQCMEYIQAHRPVYVHCFAGLGRAGTIAAAWLIRQGISPFEAIRTIRKMRPGAIESDAQFDALLEYAALR